MPDDPPRIYWDSCVLLSYVNGIPERLPTIEELMRLSRAGKVELLSSVLSQVEVAFAASEKRGQALDPEVEEQIVGLWAPGSPITPVEFYELIADRARGLMRQAIAQGWGSLKPADAIHLATAQQIGVDEFHTYDGDLQAWDGRAGLPVREPQTAQGQLGTDSENRCHAGIRSRVRGRVRRRTGGRRLGLPGRHRPMPRPREGLGQGEP